MKIYLILFVLEAGLPNPGVIQKSYPDMRTCVVRLEQAIEDWTRAHDGKTGFGIVGRCSKEPLNTIRI